MRERADCVDRAAARAIYSDDPDAADALRVKIAALEAEPLPLQGNNAGCRAVAKLEPETKTGDLSLLDDAQRADLLTLARVCPYQLGENSHFPSLRDDQPGAHDQRRQEAFGEAQSLAAPRPCRPAATTAIGSHGVKRPDGKEPCMSQRTCQQKTWTVSDEQVHRRALDGFPSSTFRAFEHGGAGIDIASKRPTLFAVKSPHACTRRDLRRHRRPQGTPGGSSPTATTPSATAISPVRRRLHLLRAPLLRGQGAQGA